MCWIWCQYWSVLFLTRSQLMDSQLKRAGKQLSLFSKSLRCGHLFFLNQNLTTLNPNDDTRGFMQKPKLRTKRHEARGRSLFAPFSDATLNIYIVWQDVIDVEVVLGTLQLQKYRTKRTGPQIAFANLGGTVTLEDYNENKYTKFTKETYIIACTDWYQLKS